MATVGFLLSPLSWWNDLYVNIPIAYVLAWLASYIDERLFGPAMIFFYWMTNLAGLLLLHRGMASMAKEQEPNKKRIVFDIALSLVYSGILTLLVYTGILKLPQHYFGQ